MHIHNQTLYIFLSSIIALTYDADPYDTWFTLDFYCHWICLATEPLQQWSFLIRNWVSLPCHWDDRLAVKSLQCQIQPQSYITYINCLSKLKPVESIMSFIITVFDFSLECSCLIVGYRLDCSGFQNMSIHSAFAVKKTFSNVLYHFGMC